MPQHQSHWLEMSLSLIMRTRASSMAWPWVVCVILVSINGELVTADVGIVRRLSDLGGKPYNVSYNSRFVH